MTTTSSTQKNKYAEFFVLFSALKEIGYPLDRDDLIHQFTSGTQTSLKKLTPTEYRDILTWMNLQLSNHRTKRNYKETRQKRKVIALFCQMDYLKEDKADMDRINAWCESHGHLKVKLNGYSGTNLTKLVSQAERVYTSFISAL